MKKAVIFDLDGVITDTAAFHFKAWKSVADQLNIPFDETKNELLKGIDRIASLRIILEGSEREFSEDEMLKLATQKNLQYQSLIGQMTESDIFPGVADLIEQLKSQHYQIGLASVSKNADFVLQRLKITSLFDYVADANKIARSKPDPEIFLTVAENLGVDNAACIGVEDAAAGVEAIKAAKMPAIGVGDKRVLKLADIIVEHTGDISLELIEQLLASKG